MLLHISIVVIIVKIIKYTSQQKNYQNPYSLPVTVPSEPSLFRDRIRSSSLLPAEGRKDAGIGTSYLSRGCSANGHTRRRSTLISTYRSGKLEARNILTLRNGFNYNAGNVFVWRFEWWWVYIVGRSFKSVMFFVGKFYWDKLFQISDVGNARLILQPKVEKNNQKLCLLFIKTYDRH